VYDPAASVDGTGITTEEFVVPGVGVNDPDDDPFDPAGAMP
jgi:hypothetical protein